MYAELRGTTIYFDVEGAGLVPDGGVMRQKPEAMVIHGGPGGDHSGFKPSFSPLAETMQLIYFDHRGQGRSARVTPAATRSTRTSRTWRRCGATWAWAPSSASAPAMAAWSPWRMRPGTPMRSPVWCSW